ncbi:MAG: FHA domain-containing protein [Methanobacteriota archaeon]|nr:MAG: FHA domain-containing protein [Euryarchaeota archaeon]
MTLSVPCTLKGRRGRYQVESKLAEGGMSTVYVGKSNRGQAVIVKEASGPDLEQAQERLHIEADILKALASPGHPRVVRYLDEGTSLGPFCLVEEKLEGDTLSERYRDKAADVATASRHILQLLEALAYLHGRNVIHRDIKPNNIILDVRREVVLIDFGAAKKEFRQFTGAGTVIYTPGWGAPEQNLGEATPASDLYGVGAVFFFLLTGQDPRGSMKQLSGGKTELFRSPRDLEPGVTEDLSRVVIRAMAYNPKDRFPTAQDMAQAISGGSEKTLGFPHLVVLGKKCKLKKEMEIGRDHKTCDQSCAKKGFGHPPEIGILDTERYLSKHHARIVKDPKGRCWIEDLGSMNGTAMSHDGGRTYRQIPGFKKQELADGDVLALVYKAGKGPYMTITFKGGTRRGGT